MVFVLVKWFHKPLLDIGLIISTFSNVDEIYNHILILDKPLFLMNAMSPYIE